MLNDIQKHILEIVSGMAADAQGAVNIRANGKRGETLETYLNENVFAGAAGSTIAPDAEDAAGLDAYTAKFQQALSAEAAAVAEMK